MYPGGITMNSSRSSRISELLLGVGDDSEVMRILDAYLSGIETGEPADPDKLLADHPGLASQLRAYLDVMQLAGRVADDSGAVACPAGSGVLTTLNLGSDRPPQVQLLELSDEREPLVMPSSSAMPHSIGGAFGRYQLQGEIARGGMGAILRGRDVDLGRELAIKVLLESHQGDPLVVRRFVEEAQIGGQLQHPGVVPVYELGTFPDRRPYFAMKLVKGRTLASLLHERTGPADDLPRFLGIFEQVCQTMAYAHARGVIHRDLKPSNVMVGSFGEVQVMDWGLAKVLLQGGIADEAASQPVHEAGIATVRSGPGASGSESQAGSVLGTPAYMAPEQARGEVARIDERADVFGLGAILCEILTAKPPYSGSTREEIRSQAARGDLTPAFAQLEASGAEIELVALARACLSPELERRPRNAGAVVGRVTRYLTGVQDRLRSAELARVEAQTRAEEAEARATIERSRRRLTVALTASFLITASVLGGGWGYLAQQRAARLAASTRAVTDALAEMERLRDQAQSATPGDLTLWLGAVSAAKRARGLLAQGESDGALRARVDAAVAEVEQAHAEAENQIAEITRDRTLLAELEEIRLGRSGHWDPKRTDEAYALAFRKFGIDFEQLDAKDAGQRIVQRSQPVELASYVDDWALQRRKVQGTRDELSWRRLLMAAKGADPDPWRVALRDQIGAKDQEALRRMAGDEKTLETQSTQNLLLLASVLIDRGHRDQAERVLRRAWRSSPDDFWVNVLLTDVHHLSSDKRDEAVRFASVAVSIRPLSSMAHENLGFCLSQQGKLAEAIIQCREAIRLNPDLPALHVGLGIVLKKHGNLDEAIAEYRTAVRLNPESPVPHNELGIALDIQGRSDEAIGAHRAAILLKPEFADAHNNLGLALRHQGKLAEAIAELREALRLKPDNSNIHTNLGLALSDHGRPDEALAQHREALRLNPDSFEAHGNLAKALKEQGNVDEAIAEHREALRLKPDSAIAHNNLGAALEVQGRSDEAIAEYSTAIRLTPDYPEAHCNLGLALQRKGRFGEGLTTLRRGHELGSKNPNWRYPSAEWVRQAERGLALDRKLPALLAGKAKPSDAAETLGCAELCYHKELHGASARLWSEAFRAQPKLADDMQAENRYFAACAAALASSGQGKDDPPLDDGAKARWRKQAMDWLKADLAAWSKILESGPQQERQTVTKTLQHWKSDTDLAGIRDAAALAKLPAEEQAVCRAVWAEVGSLVKKAQATASK
jgi:serine/threonine-protein kinase